MNNVNFSIQWFIISFANILFNNTSTISINGYVNHIFSLLFTVETYLSPVETHCSNVDYFPNNDDEKLTQQPNDDAVARLHLARSCVALFILR